MVAHGSSYHLLSLPDLTELCLALGCNPKETATMSKSALLSALRTKLTLCRQARSAEGCRDPGTLRAAAPLPTCTTQSDLPRQARRPPQHGATRTTAVPRPTNDQQQRRRLPTSTLTADVLEELEQRCRCELREQQVQRRVAPPRSAGGLHDTVTAEVQLRQLEASLLRRTHNHRTASPHGNSDRSKAELDERVYDSVDELIRTTQQLSPISSSRQEHPAGDNAADTAAVADVDVNTSSPRTPSEPSLSEKLSGDDAHHSGIEYKVRCGTVSTPPVVPVHRHNGDANSTGQGTQQPAEMGAGVESLTISSLTAGAVAAAAAQPGVVFELRVNDEQTEKQRSADMTTKRKVRRSAGTGSASSSAAGQSAQLEIHLSAAEQQLMDHMQRRVGGEPIVGSTVTDVSAFFRQLGSAVRTSYKY